MNVLLLNLDNGNRTVVTECTKRYGTGQQHCEPVCSVAYLRNNDVFPTPYSPHRITLNSGEDVNAMSTVMIGLSNE